MARKAAPRQSEADDTKRVALRDTVRTPSPTKWALRRAYDLINNIEPETLNAEDFPVIERMRETLTRLARSIMNAKAARCGECRPQPAGGWRCGPRC